MFEIASFEKKCENKKDSLKMQESNIRKCALH